MYLIGGSFTEKLYNDAWCFDFNLLSWTQLNLKGNIPAPREGFSCINFNQRFVYLYGGWDGEQEITFNEHFILDLENELWLQIKNIKGDFISDRESQSINSIGNKLYLFGGQGTNQGDKSDWFNDLYRIDILGLESLERKLSTLSNLPE